VKRLFLVTVIIVACAVALGFFRGWFHVGTEGSDHQADVTISVDRDKIRVDEEKVKKSVHDLGKNSTEKANEGSATREHSHESP
jgi:preprotein translocase subunit SecF